MAVTQIFNVKGSFREVDFKPLPLQISRDQTHKSSPGEPDPRLRVGAPVKETKEESYSKEESKISIEFSTNPFLQVWLSPLGRGFLNSEYRDNIKVSEIRQENTFGLSGVILQIIFLAFGAASREYSQTPHCSSREEHRLFRLFERRAKQFHRPLNFLGRQFLHFGCLESRPRR